MTEAIRPAVLEDAVATAAIKNAWIDDSDWLPRCQSHAEILETHQANVIAKKEVYVIGDPVMGYLALNDDDYVTSLFCDPKGQGLGKALLDHAKTLRTQLQLWSFVDNIRACRFYEREGFTEQRREEGANDENLPDILYRWEAT